jgi:type II secretory pathway pseudopilin PulG
MKIKLLKNLHAVTLMELLFVIIIIGVVISFGIPYYQGTITAARQKTAKLCLNMIKDAQEIYYDENNLTYYTSGPSIYQINASLNLAITADNLSYACTPPQNLSDGYKCTATFSSQWCCRVTKNINPICSTGACP